jgi:hypothetical protein
MRPQVTAHQFYIDADTLDGDGSLANIIRVAGALTSLTSLTVNSPAPSTPVIQLNSFLDGGAIAYHGRITLPSGVAGKPAHTIDTTRHTFNGTPDPICSFGYNQLASGGVQQAGEPGMILGIEGDYNDGAERWTEAYFQHVGADGVTTRRPFYTQVNRATDAVTTQIQADSLTFKDSANAVAMTVQTADVTVRNTFHVGSALSDGVLALHTTLTEARMRLAGGAKDLLQLGSITGVTQVQIGPAAITGTAEVIISTTEVRFTDGLVRMGAAGGPVIRSGAGAPATDDPIGSLYMRTDGGAGTSLYVKQAAGAGGWAGK